MRILYLCADFGIPILGFKGASVHVREVADALIELGHEVVILTPNVGAGNTTSAQVVHIPAPPLHPGLAAPLRRVGALSGRGDRPAREVRELSYNAVLLAAAQRFAIKWKPALIYERYALFGIVGGSLARRLGVPHLLEVNAPLRLERKRGPGLALEWPARWYERRIFSRADRVLCVSQPMADYVAQHGARRDRVLVQPNAVDTTKFHPDARAVELRTRMGVADEHIVIGFVGSLKPWHGIELLIEAVAQARAYAPQLRLLIVGEGPARQAVERAIAERALRDVAILTGSVAHADIPDYLAAMDIAVAPYVEVPGFYFSPLKVFEYMAAGRPVVASRLGQIPDILQDGVTGFLHTPGDANALCSHLLALAAQPEMRAEVGRRAACHVQAHHSWANVAQRITALADQLTME